MRRILHICFYGSIILYLGFATHFILFFHSRPKKPETIFISEPAYNPNLHRTYFMGAKYTNKYITRTNKYVSRKPM